MPMRIGDRDFSSFVESVIGTAKIVLVRYGPGSAGELLLKEYISSTPTGMNGVMLSTCESEAEMSSFIDPRSGNVRAISIADLLGRRIETYVRRDRFLSEGIMVTDLLEISMQDDRTQAEMEDAKALSVITEIALKQVLPFRLALDSLSDLVSETSAGEVIPRLRILSGVLRKVGGNALVGAPAGWTTLGHSEHLIFDAIVEVRSVRSGASWERTLTLAHLRNAPIPPQQWSVTVGGR